MRLCWPSFDARTSCHSPPLSRRHNNSKKSSRRKGNLKGLRPLMNPAYVRKVLRLGFKGYTLKHMIPQHKDEIDYILRKLRERGRVF